jgi:aryl-alcohol dehydrogenase-like predicted oxidoreductase
VLEDLNFRPLPRQGWKAARKRAGRRACPGKPPVSRFSTIDSCQNAFSLLEQNDRQELLPWLHESGVGYLAYGPLGFSLLTGALDRDTAFADGDWGAKERGRRRTVRSRNIRT